MEKTKNGIYRNALPLIATCLLVIFTARMMFLSTEVANLVLDSSSHTSRRQSLEPARESQKVHGIHMSPHDKDSLALTILPNELPGYTGWARPIHTLVDSFRIVRFSSAQKVTVGQDWSVELECTHEACKKGGSLFYIRAYGRSLLPGRVKDHGNGNYTVTILAHDEGLYTLEVVLTFSRRPDWYRLPLPANQEELAYEGYLVPGFPLQFSVAQADWSKALVPSHTLQGVEIDSRVQSTTSRPLCSARQLIEMSLDSALKTGRWLVVNKTRTLPFPTNVQIASLAATQQINKQNYIEGFSSIGFQMDYFPLECDIFHLDHLTKAETWRNALDKNSHKWINKTIHLLFIGDSNILRQFEYFRDYIAEPINHLNGQMRFTFIPVKQYWPETLPKAREQLRNLTNEYKDDLFFSTFNVGLHEISNRCSHDFGHTIEGPCHEMYQKDLEELIEVVQSIPSLLNVWQSTTAGWPKWGVYGVSWYQTIGQRIPKEPNFCAFLNRLAWDIMSNANIPVMDAYWLTLSRPDHREILYARETPTANKLVHLGPEVYSVLIRKFAMMVLEVLEKGEEGQRYL